MLIVQLHPPEPGICGLTHIEGLHFLLMND